MRVINSPSNPTEFTDLIRNWVLDLYTKYAPPPLSSERWDLNSVYGWQRGWLRHTAGTRVMYTCGGIEFICSTLWTFSSTVLQQTIDQTKKKKKGKVWPIWWTEGFKILVFFFPSLFLFIFMFIKIYYIWFFVCFELNYF